MGQKRYRFFGLCVKLFTTETLNLNPGGQNIVAVAKRTSWREDDDGDDDDDGSGVGDDRADDFSRKFQNS